MEVIEKETVKINNKESGMKFSVDHDISEIVSQLETGFQSDYVKETTIIINPVNRGSLQETLEYHIGSNCLDELSRLIKFKGHDISKIDYSKIVELLSFLTIESSYDKLSNEAVTALVELPNSKNYAKSMQAYYNLFAEGFIIISDTPFDDEFGELIYELDTLKMSYVWKYIIDEIADFTGVAKTYGCGLIISDNINFKYHNGYFLLNPALYLEMDWEECLVDVIFNAVDLFAQHTGLYNDITAFKAHYMKILRSVVVKRLNIKDIYNKTKEVTRKKKN